MGDRFVTRLRRRPIQPLARREVLVTIRTRAVKKGRSCNYRVRMGRRLLTSATIVGLVVLLSACSPPTIGTVGIERNEDGSLTALVRVCRDSVDTLILRPINSFPKAPNGSPLGDHWESVPDERVSLTSSVTDSADVPFPVDATALESDVLYGLWAAGRHGNAFSGVFGASEVAALQPGEVLAEPISDDAEATKDRDDGAGGFFVTVTRDEFEQRATSFCQ